MATLAQEQAMLQLSAPIPRALSPMELMAQVLQTQNPKDAVEVVKELAKLQMEMRRQDAEEAFNTALASCQKAIRIVVPDLEGENGHKYPSYKALDAAVRPIYSQYEFSMSFGTADCSIPDEMIVVCDVSRGLHSRRYQLPMDRSGKGAKGGGVMPRSQAVGAGMSMAKRYLAAAIWNIPIGEEGVLVSDEFMDTVKAITMAFDKKSLWTLYNTATDKYEKDPQALKILNDAKRKRAKELGA